MRARLAMAAMAVSLTAFGLQSSGAAPRSAAVHLDPGPGGFASANVHYVASIPTGAGVSARVLMVGNQRRLYVSSAHSLVIYDITDPALPLPLGALPFYNWENEDIAVSPDGSVAILTEFTDTFYLHVVDTENPRTPILAGSIIGDGSHTAECADPHCNYLFASNGKTYDITDRANPKEAPEEQWWSTVLDVHGGHALHRDSAGYWIADEKPLVVFKATNPLAPTRVAKGPFSLDTAYQHNNVRPNAVKYRARKDGDTSPGLRPGELLMTEGETNENPGCGNGSGAFSTWSMVGFDKGKPLRQLNMLHPVTGTYTNGDAAVNAMGCSGHWFSVREDMPEQYAGEYLVAAGWYEHGARFLAVKASTGEIRQVGYFQPVVGAASAAYWIKGTDYVYVVDYARGIDILRFDPKGAVPSVSETNASWLAKLHAVEPLAATERYFCRLAQEQPTR